VATSGAADIIRDGETGFRIEPGDSDAIAMRLVQLYRDRAFIEVLSKNATAMARCHHPSDVVDKIERCLYQAIRLHYDPSLSLALPC
jgi:glycosyltransferase involved in cell wall biosynthesis